MDHNTKVMLTAYCRRVFNTPKGSPLLAENCDMRKLTTPQLEALITMLEKGGVEG